MPSRQSSLGHAAVPKGNISLCGFLSSPRNVSSTRSPPPSPPFHDFSRRAKMRSLRKIRLELRAEFSGETKRRIVAGRFSVRNIGETSSIEEEGEGSIRCSSLFWIFFFRTRWWKIDRETSFSLSLSLSLSLSRDISFGWFIRWKGHLFLVLESVSLPILTPVKL